MATTISTRMLRRVPIIFALAVLFFIALHPHDEFDTQRLLAGHFSSQTPDSFPLFQHVLITILWNIGVRSGENILRAFVMLSFLSYIAIAAVAYVITRRFAGAAGAILALLVILASPLFYYASSTFAEIPAALVTLFFTAAVVLNANVIVVALLFIIASTTKETAPLLLAVVWLLRLSNRKPVTEIAMLVLSFAISFALAAALNYHRFGTWYNFENFKSFRIVHSLPQQAKYFLALFFSPSGGIAIFWPLFFLLLVIALRFLSARTFIVIATMLLLTLGLSRWHAPFGWVAWGPRLMIPWIPSMIVLLLSQPKIVESLRRILTTNISIAALLITLFTIPHLIVIDSFGLTWNSFDPHGIPPEYGDVYYKTQNQLMWHHTPLIALPMRYLPQPIHAILAILLFAAVYAMLRLIAENRATINATGSASSAPLR